MTTPIPFVDHDTWRTAVTYRGETTWFAGRVLPGHTVPLSPDGVTSVREERLDQVRLTQSQAYAMGATAFRAAALASATPPGGVRFITCDFAEIEERCAAFASSLSQPMNKPILSPRTEYTVHFDGPAQLKPAKYVGTDVITPSVEPGARRVLDGERVVADLRFVSRIETTVIPPTVAHLQAHIEALEKAHAEEVEALRASRDEHKRLAYEARYTAQPAPCPHQYGERDPRDTTLIRISNVVSRARFGNRAETIASVQTLLKPHTDQY